MNEDIKALIEREAENYADYNAIMPRASLKLDDIKHYGTKSFTRGANFALSLFKWRKVEEEPEDEADLPNKFKSVYIKTDWDRYTTGFLGHDSWITDFDLGKEEKITHWMPIPNIS